METSLTFQEHCLERLKVELGRIGRQLEALESRPDNPALSRGKSEYLHARVSSSLVEIWIYENQVDVTARDYMRVFESLDFASEGDLISAFLKAVLALLGEGKPAEGAAPPRR